MTEFALSCFNRIKTNMSIDPSRILDHLTNTIGIKVQTNIKVDMEEVEFAKNIVKCFHQIWEWRRTYPEFRAELEDGIFQRIFDDMSSHCSSTDDTELSTVCAICDLEFPLLNHDLAFSFDMHKQEPEHVEVVNAMNEFHSVMMSPANLNEQKPNLPDDIRGDASHLATPPAPRDDICSTRGIARSTKELEKKQSKQKRALLSSTSINFENQPLKIVSSVTDIYTSNGRSRLTYFLNKICILLHDNRGYICGFCNYFAADENCVKRHLGSPFHEARLTQEIKNIDPKDAYIEPGIFVTPGDIELRCHLCGAILEINDHSAYFGHVRSRCHRTNLKIHFSLPIFEDWERGIILKAGSPYCVFCELVLPSEALMQKHLVTRDHRLKFK